MMREAYTYKYTCVQGTPLGGRGPELQQRGTREKIRPFIVLTEFIF